MRDKKNFAVFILTHGRPNDVITIQALKDSNYTGKTYIIIDNEDSQADEYRKVFGKEMVIQFDKAAIGKTFDIADTRTDRRATVYARNAAFQIARNLGLDYHMQLDDDYKTFMYRLVKDNELKGVIIRQLDQVIDAMIKFLEDTNATTVAMAQGGDYIGGVQGFYQKPLMRKAMNSWLFRTERPLTFIGRMNDDVNTYLTQGKVGKLFFQISNIMLNQLSTQSNAGGNTEAYKAYGTYVKSFYSVMAAPSCCKIDLMGKTNKRLHHKINWNHAIPKILDEKFKKQ